MIRRPLAKALLGSAIASKDGFNPFRFFRSFKKILKESLIAICICIVGDLFAGILLGQITLFLEILPGLIVLIPGAIGMRGNIFGALGSRLSTNLHIGIIEPEWKGSIALSENVKSAVILTLILSIFLAFASKGICTLLGVESISLVGFLIISLVAGILSALFLVPTTIFVAVKSFKGGWDPDNVTTPIIAATGDLFALPSIVIGAVLYLYLRSFNMDLLFCIILIVICLVFIVVTLVFHSSEEIERIIKQSIPVLFVCSCLGTLTGSVLDNQLESILVNPVILTLVPLFSGESGNLVSIVSARLSSILHFGCIEPNLSASVSTENLKIMGSLALIVYPLIGAMVWLASFVLGYATVGLGVLVCISVVAGLILTPVIFLISFYLSTESYKHGLDPDNIVIPISTSLTDPLATGVLVLVVGLLFGFIF